MVLHDVAISDRERERASLVAASTCDFGPRAWRYKRRLQIFDKTGGYCWHCNNPLGFDWHADHLLPRAHGGSNKLDNLVPSCPDCNQEKSDHIEWKPAGF